MIDRDIRHEYKMLTDPTYRFWCTIFLFMWKGLFAIVKWGVIASIFWLIYFYFFKGK